MNRRSFLKTLALGVGAAVSLTAAGFDAFAVGHALRPRNKDPFPVWDIKWKQSWKPGWAAQTKMNVMDGQVPPLTRCWNGITYDRWKYDTHTRRAWYWRR